MTVSHPFAPALDHLSARDPRLGELIAGSPFPAYESSGDLYYDLVSCLLDQQIHYRAPRNSIFRRFLDLFPGGYPHPRQVLTLPEETAMGVKMSARKYQHLCALASWWLQEGETIAWSELSDEAVRQHLSVLPGVGPWTREIILLFTLERPDILPLDDYGLKKAITGWYELTSEAALRAKLDELSRCWQPHRSLACRYLWATPKPSANHPSR